MHNNVVFLYLMIYHIHKICQTILAFGSILIVVGSSDLTAQDSIRYDYQYLLNQLEQARRDKDPKILGEAYFQLAGYEEKVLYNSAKAFENYLIAKQYFELTSNKEKVAAINQVIARKYLNSGLFVESIALYEQVINFYRSIGDDHHLTKALYELSKVYRKKREVDKELFYLKEALKVKPRDTDEQLAIAFMLEQVRTYERLNEPDSAMYVAGKAFTLAAEKSFFEEAGEAVYYIAKINMRKGDYAKAEKYFKMTEDLLSSIPYSETRLLLYDKFLELYGTTQQYQKAWSYAMKRNMLSDSINERSRAELLTNLAVKYETNERKKDIKILEIEKDNIFQKSIQQRNTLYFLVGFLGLLLILIYLLVRFYTHKIHTEKIINQQKDEINSAKIKELEDSIKIKSMTSMIEGQEQERERISKDLHDSLGGLLSAVKLQFDRINIKDHLESDKEKYKEATKLLDHAIEEVRSISGNLQPVALKNLGLIPAIKDLVNKYHGSHFPEITFQYYDMPDKIDNMLALSIYRIIQELVNNTVKHAQASEILIQLNGEIGQIILQYEDDGTGFVIDENLKYGMGLQNLHSRVNFVKGNISFETKPGDGVSVMIKIPLDSHETNTPAYEKNETLTSGF